MQSGKNSKKAEPSAGKKPAGKEVASSAWQIPHLLVLALICLLGVIIYSNSFDCSFHFDDNPNILENPAVQDGAGFQSVWDYSHNRFWPYYSLALNYRFGGLEVWGYHFFNLLVHLINACLVYWIVLLIFATPVLKGNALAGKKRQIALFAALLFVAHPLATQSVTYIVQRMASMVALFYFLSLALYIKGRISSGVLKYFFFAAAAISALMAFTSKENGYTLPIALILAEFWLLQTKNFSFSLKSYRIYAALLIMGFLIWFTLDYFTLSVFAPIPPAHGNSYTLTWKNYLFTEFSVLIKYIQLLFLPLSQNLDYDFPVSDSLSEMRTLLSLLFLLVLIGFALFQYNKNRLLSFCILWFFITLAIESSVVPIADVIFEHRTYLPSLGFVILLSYGLFYFSPRPGKNAPVLILSAISLIYAGLAYSRNKVWKDEETLYSDVIQKAPTKARGWASLGDTYRDVNDLERAMNHYNQAIKLNPAYAKALFNRAGIFEKQNEPSAAVIDYSRAIAADTAYLKAYYNRGTVYNRLRKYDSAIADLTKTISLDRSYTNAYVNRGSAYVNAGRYQEGIDDLTKAISLNNQLPGSYYNRGNAYLYLKKEREALADYSSAIALSGDMKDAYYNRAIIYNGFEQYDSAIADYSKAISIDPLYVQAYVNRGAIYAGLKKWDMAIVDYKKALQIKPDFSLAVSNLKFAMSQAGTK